MDAKERLEAEQKRLTAWKDAVKRYSTRLTQMIEEMCAKPEVVPDEQSLEHMRYFVDVVNRAGKGSKTIHSICRRNRRSPHRLYK